jgi:AraC-like DNA-binding protein
MPDPIDLRPAPMSYFQLILRRFGVNDTLRGAILAGVGLSPEEIESPGSEINFTQQLRQFDNMNRLFGDGWLLDAPELWRPAAHGALGVAVMTSANLNEAILVITRYISARTPNQRLKLVRGEETVTLRHGLPIELPEAQTKISVEAVFLSLGAMLRWLLGDVSSQVRYEFAWRRPENAERFREVLGAQVAWNSGSNAVIIPVSLLEIRSPLADPVLHDAAVHRLEQARRSSRASGGVKSRIEHLLANSDSGRLGSGEAARTLGLSQRTLVRRLAESGMTYRDLVDSELKARAQRWLDAGVLSRGEISERLGFADATSFSRACRRWFKAVR